MEKILEIYISSLIIAFTEIYIWNKLLNSERKIFCLSNIITVLLISFVITSNYLWNSDYIKVIVITLFFAFVIKKLYGKKFLKSLGTAIFAQVIMSIGEIIFVLLVINIKNINIQTFKLQYFSNIYTNIGIALISIILVHFSQTKNFFKQIASLTNDIYKK